MSRGRGSGSLGIANKLTQKELKKKASEHAIIDRKKSERERKKTKRRKETQTETSIHTFQEIHTGAYNERTHKHAYSIQKKKAHTQTSGERKRNINYESLCA